MKPLAFKKPFVQALLESPKIIPEVQNVNYLVDTAFSDFPIGSLNITMDFYKSLKKTADQIRILINDIKSSTVIYDAYEKYCSQLHAEDQLCASIINARIQDHMELLWYATWINWLKVNSITHANSKYDAIQNSEIVYDVSSYNEINFDEYIIWKPFYYKDDLNTVLTVEQYIDHPVTWKYAHITEHNSEERLSRIIWLDTKFISDQFSHISDVHEDPNTWDLRVFTYDLESYSVLELNDYLNDAKELFDYSWIESSLDKLVMLYRNTIKYIMHINWSESLSTDRALISIYCSDNNINIDEIMFYFNLLEQWEIYKQMSRSEMIKTMIADIDTLTYTMCSFWNIKNIDTYFESKDIDYDQSQHKNIVELFYEILIKFNISPQEFREEDIEYIYLPAEM